MALTLSRLLKDNLTQPFYPKVTGEPKIVIWIFSFPDPKAHDIKDTLYAQLPRYWTSQGIVDCKILFAATSGSALLIESWESREEAQSFRQSKAWQSFRSQIKSLGGQIESIVNDSFELIE